eukprot:SAG11_NODE_16149_length_555_cov_9.239035_1_plen_70_part_00
MSRKELMRRVEIMHEEEPVIAAERTGVLAEDECIVLHSEINAIYSLLDNIKSRMQLNIPDDVALCQHNT